MKKQNNKKILIVDDFELNRAILCEMFCRDYEVIEAGRWKTGNRNPEKGRDKHQSIVAGYCNAGH